MSFDVGTVVYYFGAFFVVWLAGLAIGYVFSWFRRILNDSL